MLKSSWHSFLFYSILATQPIFSLEVQQTPQFEQAPPKSNLMQTEIKHVVVLILENRSFDNILAWLYNQNNPPENFIPSDTDPTYLGLDEDNLAQYTNVLKNSVGDVVFTCTPIKGVPSTQNGKYLNSPQFDPFEPFEHVTDQVFGFDGTTTPNMSGFLQDYASQWYENYWICSKTDICAVMETYTAKELPVLYGLARQYAVSDLWFSSVPTQTYPNRAFAACGTSEGQIVNGSNGESIFTSDTIWNRLTEESTDTTWSIFWQADMVPILFPGPFTGPNSFTALNNIPNLSDHFLKMDSFHKLARNGQLPNYSFIEPQWTLSINISPEVNWVQQADVLHKGVKAFVLGLQGNDLHPPGDVRTCENHLANIYTSLIANQEAWNQTLLVITFDEHGGLFDHIVPPAAIPPDGQNQNGFNFDRYGVRVPTLFISPRINKGTVIRSDNPNVPFDHTSLIATILNWKNIDKAKWNMGKRVDSAPLFDTVITLEKPRTDCVIPCETNQSPVSNSGDSIQMGDKFCLRNQKGNYFINVPQGVLPYTRLGKDQTKMQFEFGDGSGNVTHGSFVLLKAQDPALEEANIVDVSTFSYCMYEKNQHTVGQWWTIKSLENPSVGAPIHFGDRVYFENHLYMNFVNMIPGRLVEKDGIFSKFVRLAPISEDGCEDYYWIIEKP